MEHLVVASGSGVITQLLLHGRSVGWVAATTTGFLPHIFWAVALFMSEGLSRCPAVAFCAGYSFASSVPLGHDDFDAVDAVLTEQSCALVSQVELGLAFAILRGLRVCATQSLMGGSVGQVYAVVGIAGAQGANRALVYYSCVVLCCFASMAYLFVALFVCRVCVCVCVRVRGCMRACVCGCVRV